MTHEYGALSTVGIVAVVGLVTGVGQLLASTEILTARIIVGRALSSSALGVAAGVGLMWAPEMPLPALVGLAACIASLGTSGLERLLQRFIK